MLPTVRPKLKVESADELDQYPAAGAWGAPDHRERVREMTVKMAAEAGFGRTSLPEEGHDTYGSTVAAGMIRVEPRGELALPSMKTPRYDGKADWEAFHAQFELLARASKWSTEVKALQLAMCLTGDALSSLLLLSPDDRSDYNALVGALKRRFGLCTAASLLRSELCSRQRRPGEPLRDLANDIEGLVHRTYAHMPPAIQSELARDHFLRALLPADLRIQTLLAHPRSLLEALELASEREMLCVSPLGATMDNSPKVRAASGAEMDMTTPPWAEELSQLVRTVSLQGGRQSRPRPRTCWGCGQPGHLIRECPHAPANQGKETGTA